LGHPSGWCSGLTAACDITERTFDRWQIECWISPFTQDHFALLANGSYSPPADLADKSSESRLQAAPFPALHDQQNLGQIVKRLVPAADERDQVAFDANEGRKVANSVTRLVAGKGLPKALNCARAQADQLVDKGLLTPIVDDFIEGHGRVRKAFDTGQIASFLRDLRNAARSGALLSWLKIPCQHQKLPRGRRLAAECFETGGRTSGRFPVADREAGSGDA
jgi:hypothetical protein